MDRDDGPTAGTADGAWWLVELPAAECSYLRAGGLKQHSAPGRRPTSPEAGRELCADKCASASVMSCDAVAASSTLSRLVTGAACEVRVFCCELKCQSSPDTGRGCPLLRKSSLDVVHSELELALGNCWGNLRASFRLE